MVGDWIKLHRQMLDSPIFQHDGLFRLWCYCLMRANWAPRKWLIPGSMKEIAVPRGAFITGRESLFASLYPRTNSDGQIIRYEHLPSSRTTWRWIVCLSEMECLKLETVSNLCTLVTIVKYSTYQDVAETNVQVAPDSCPTLVQPLSTKEESKKERKEEEVGVTDKGPAERFTIPTVAEVRSYCEERCNKVDPEKFFDFYESKGWKVGKTGMKDWRASVRTWEKDSTREPAKDPNRRPRIPAADSEELKNWRP